jgi:hypothetical protein
LYNPFSVLNAFKDLEFRDYWFESATPSFLVNLLRQEDYNLPQIEGVRGQPHNFYQLRIRILVAGSLTVSDRIFDDSGRSGRDLHPELPEPGSQTCLYRSLTVRANCQTSSGRQFPGTQTTALSAAGNFHAFFETMQAIFASIPYDIASKRDEAYFHTIFYLMMSASGMVEVQSSVLTSDGRIDLVVQFRKKSTSLNSNATRARTLPYSRFTPEGMLTGIVTAGNQLP